MTSPRTLKMRPSVTSPTGTVMEAPVSTTSMPRAMPSVESMATARTRSSPRCCWTSQTRSPVCRRALPSAVDRDRPVDLGQRVGEDGLDDDAGDLLDAADVAGSSEVSAGGAVSVVAMVLLRRATRRPATTSTISEVISAWRARFISSVRSSMTSPAFSEALRIAVMRAPCSEAVDSSSAR
jgi:hypothetical protein